MSAPKSIPVYLPEPIWGRIATIADDRGVSVEDLLTTAVMQIISPGTVEERIVDLVRAGFPDKVIASRTGEVVGRVANIRRNAGLAPNKFRPHHNIENRRAA